MSDDPQGLKTNKMIFLTDKLDIENLTDEKYKKPFYLTLKDSEHESWDDLGDDGKHRQRWTENPGKTRGRGLGKDIEAIFTLT